MAGRILSHVEAPLGFLVIGLDLTVTLKEVKKAPPPKVKKPPKKPHKPPPAKQGDPHKDALELPDWDTSKPKPGK